MKTSILSKIRKASLLWSKAKVNPDNGKATTIPILNVHDIYGRVFTLSYLGFLVAFLSWFAFPPLMGFIKADMKLTPAQVNNSNIVGLCATLIARIILGPLCDRYGPRLVMAGTLIAGAVPTAFVPLVNNVSGIYAIRFFIGILGGTFVPCQFWTAVFYDKPIVGTAAALTAGWGNAGGGIAFFVMPAITKALERNGLSLHHAWRYSFDVFPLIIILAVAIVTLLFGQDCPEGRWCDRTRLVSIQGENGMEIRALPKNKTGEECETSFDDDKVESQQCVSTNDDEKDKNKFNVVCEPISHISEDSNMVAQDMTPLEKTVSRASAAVNKMSKINAPRLDPDEENYHFIENITLWEFLKISFSPHTMLVALPYATTFGGELAIESILSSLYVTQSKKHGTPWSVSVAGDWGAMLGLLNIFFRPLGGYVSDVVYAYFKTPVAKKYWMLICGFLMGVFLLYIGLCKNMSMTGLIVSMAFMSLFMEMGNGANYSVVPHISPVYTGIVSGTTGAFGNVGGVLFSLAFRFSSFSDGNTDYLSAIWYLGITFIGLNVLCVFLPLSKNNYY